MISGHGGAVQALARKIGCLPEEILDLSSNINPQGPMPGLLAHLQKTLRSVSALPEVDSRGLIDSAAKHFGVDPEGIVAGNGTTPFIYTLPEILKTQSALIIGPTYADYADGCSLHRRAVQHLFSHEKEAFYPNLSKIRALAPGFDTVFLCNPNNPTGAWIPGKDLESLITDCPKTRFIIDESYLSFVTEGEDSSLISCDLPNRIVLHSFSKIFAIPGLRAGLMFFHPRMRSAVVRTQLPWSVNTLAQAAVAYLMENPERAQTFVRKSRLFLEHEKGRFLSQFQSEDGIRFFPSRTAFVLGRLSGHRTAEALCRHLEGQRILIRNCRNFSGLSRPYLRISIKQRASNTRCAEGILDFLNTPHPEPPMHRKKA